MFRKNAFTERHNNVIFNTLDTNVYDPVTYVDKRVLEWLYELKCKTKHAITTLPSIHLKHIIEESVANVTLDSWDGFSFS